MHLWVQWESNQFFNMSTTIPTNTVTALILAKNEAEMIANCIETVRWCDEIIVVDTGSQDATAEIATALGARVVSIASPSFATVRTKALKFVKTDWVLYVDADERVTPAAAKEITVYLETAAASALRFRRENICYGAHLSFGGWQDDWVVRMFRVTQLQSWTGDIHESPVFEGECISLHSPLVHLTHRDVVSSLLKSAAWTPMEARLLAEAHTPPVRARTLLRKGVFEFLRRYFLKKGYKDGMVGFIEAMTQAINRVLVYMQVWELQQKPPIENRYQAIEKEIASLWRSEKG